MKKIWIVLLVGLMVFSNVGISKADTLLDTSGRFRLEPSLMFGFGFDDVDLGVTTGGDTVGLSGGGGGGVGLTAGYGITKRLDLDLTFGWQESWMSPSVSNADGTFDRNLFLLTLKFKMPISDTQQFKIGFGVGNYISGEFDVDTSRVSGGSHTIVNYDDSMGYHITGEYEQFFSKDWSWLLGVKYYNVEYDAGSATVNGVSCSPNILIDKLKTYDGSGLDFTLSISKYF